MGEHVEGTVTSGADNLVALVVLNDERFRPVGANNQSGLTRGRVWREAVPDRNDVERAKGELGGRTSDHRDRNRKVGAGTAALSVSCG